MVRIDAAAPYIDADRLCLSHPSGFASTAHADLLSEDDQGTKLRRICDIVPTFGSEPPRPKRKPEYS